MGKSNKTNELALPLVANVLELLEEREPRDHKKASWLAQETGLSVSWAHKFLANGSDSYEAISKLAMAFDTRPDWLTDQRYVGCRTALCVVNYRGRHGMGRILYEPRLSVPWNWEDLYCSPGEGRIWEVYSYKERPEPAYRVHGLETSGAPMSKQICNVWLCLDLADEDLHELPTLLAEHGFTTSAMSIHEIHLSVREFFPDVLIISAQEPLSISDSINEAAGRTIATVIIQNSEQNIQEDLNMRRQVARVNALSIIQAIRRFVNFSQPIKAGLNISTLTFLKGKTK